MTKRWREKFGIVAGMWALLSSVSSAQTGRVEGTIRDASTGAPVENAEVALLDLATSDVVQAGRIGARTDGRGYFFVSSVPAGLYTIEIQAVGYERTLHLNQEVKPGVPTLVEISVRPLNPGWRFPTDREPSPYAVSPGVGVDVTAGVETLGGEANRAVDGGLGFDVSVRYGTSFGLFARAGAHTGALSIGEISPRYRLTSLHLEPGFVALGISRHWAPFVVGRVDIVRESVDGTRAHFTASGYSLGAGGGVTVRFLSWAALQGGMTVGTLRFGDYLLQGDRDAYLCVEALNAGTSLVQSASRCGDLGGVGLPQYNCYPPFYTYLSGDCSPPEVPQDGTARSAVWYRVWLGLNIPLARIQ